MPSFVWRRIASGHLSARSCMATYGKMGTQVPIFAWRRTQQGTRAPFEEPRHFVGGARVRSRGPRGFRRRRSSALRGVLGVSPRRSSAFEGVLGLRRGRSSAFEGSSGVSSEALECPSRGPRRFAEALECLRGGPRPSSEALECPGKRCRQRRVGCRGGGCCRIELRVASGGEGRSGLRRPGSLSSIGLWKHSFSAALPFRHRAGVSARNLGSAEAPSGATSGWNAEKEDRRRGSPRGARVQIPSAFLKRFASENMSTFVNT